MKIIRSKKTEMGIMYRGKFDKVYKYFNKPIDGDTSVNNIPTTTAPDWVSNSHSYRIKDVVRVRLTSVDGVGWDEIYREFMCLVDGSTATPWSSSEWVDMGSENKYRMYDQVLFTKSTHTEDIVTVLRTRFEDYLMLFNMENITSVHIKQVDEDSGLVLQDREYGLRDYGCDSFAEYCYTETSEKALEVFRLESSLNIINTITLKGYDTRTVGALFLGQAHNYGCTYSGASSSSQNLTKFSNNGFITQQTGQGTIRKMSGSIRVDSMREDSLKVLLDKIGNELCVYYEDGVSSIKSNLILGCHTGFNFPMTKLSIKESKFEIIGVQ